ncbi:Plasmodium vivax Vir protein, putative [Plasmodium vivax]|nr:Plasmodium vivax Vir protein, putative [Plasmodium vivax]
MSAQYKDTFFDGLIEKYRFISSLPIGHLYLAFYLKLMPKEIVDSYCNSLTTGNNADVFNDHSLCKSAINALSYIKYTINSKIFNNNTKWCEYLSYFLHDNIQKCKSCNHTEQLYIELNKIIRADNTMDNNCTIEKFTNDIEDFKKKKELYLLSEILYLIKNEYKYIFYVNEDSYNEFFRKCANIYKEIIPAGNCNKMKEYNSELSEFKKNFDETMSFLNQKEAEKPEKARHVEQDGAGIREKDVARQVEQDGAGIGEKDVAGSGEQDVEGTRGQDRKGQEAKREVSAPEAMHEQQEASVIGPGRTTETEILLIPKEDSFKGEATMVPDIDGDTSEPFVPKNVSTIGATLAGSSLFLLMMYKYTPLGSWVNKKVLRKDKLMDNMKKNKQELLLYGFGNREGGINDTMYNIRYSNISNR